MEKQIYPFINARGASNARKVIRYLNPQGSDRILEIGCGRGFVVKKLQEISPSIYGVDINATAIQHGATHQLEAQDAQNLQFPDQSFHKIYSFHTIEHVPDPRRMLAEIARVLKPEGKVLLVYPAEPIRGLFAVCAALILFKNPFRAREIHLHKLNPQAIQRFAEGLPLRHIESKFSWFVSPEYLTIFEKETG